MDRCFEKANAWVDDVIDPAEHSERSRRAKNCSALFQNWVFKAVEQEQQKTGRNGKKLSGQELFNQQMEELAKL